MVKPILTTPAYSGPDRREPKPAKNDYRSITLHTGDFYVADKPDIVLYTILGSCIAACIRDPLTGVGGMNHFLLPDTKNLEFNPGDKATRYGAYAMEQLINEILKRNGERHRLEVKVFGGGNVTRQTTKIGTKNIAFIRRYLADEGLTVVAEHLGGELPRRVHYYPATGKVMMRSLQRESDFKVIDDEQRYAATLERDTKQTDGGDVDLF